MKKTFEVLYEIETEVSFEYKNKTFFGKILEYRIIASNEATKIHYLIIGPTFEISNGVFTNSIWIDEKNIKIS